MPSIPNLALLSEKLVSHIWLGDRAALFIELGTLENGRIRKDGAHGNPRGEITVMMDCDWRIESKQSILAGNGSTSRLINSRVKKLLDDRLLLAETFGELPELLLRFASGTRIATFSRYEGQPDWSVLFNRPKLPALGVRAGRVSAEKRDA